MNKQMSVVWIFMFVIFMVGPTISAAIFENVLDSTNYENRTIASMPEINKDDYETFPAEFEKYYNDNLPFRNELIDLNSKISYYLFKDSASEKVFLGQDEWLFYVEGVQTTTGQVKVWDVELERIAENLNNAKQYFDYEGIEFVVFIAPNKSSIYQELLPEDYPIVSEKTRGQILADYLTENTDVKVIFPIDEMTEIKKDYETYLQFDTHWNNLGAYVGAKLINEQLGITMPELQELEIEAVSEARGDLAMMLHMSFENMGTDYLIGGYDNKLRDELDVMEYHNETGDERNVVVKKDSFGLRLGQYFTPEYKNAYFVSDNPEKYIREYDADVFVYEVVERNSTSIWLDLNFIETEIECENEEKNIKFKAATSRPLNYVTIIKQSNNGEEMEMIQVLESMDEMEVVVPAEETGEFYIYIFDDSEGQNVVKEMIVQY